MHPKLQQMVANLANTPPGFASLTYRSKGSGELARYNVILGANYLGTLEDSLLELSLLNLESWAGDNNIPLSLAEEAKAKVKASLEKSIVAHRRGEQSSDYTKRGQYIPLFTGLNVNANDNSLQLFGLVQSKVSLEPGEHKKVNSAPLTIAKNKLEKALKIGKFREFALDPGVIESTRLNGNTIEIG